MQDKRDHFGIFVTAQVILVLFYKYGGAGNGFIIFYQVFTLAASLVLLKIDFGQKIWRTRLRTGARAIVRGAVCGTFFAAGALAVMYVFFTIVLFPAYIRMLPLEWIVLAVARQLLIAFSEEVWGMKDDDKKEIKQLLMCIGGLLVVIFVHLAAITGFMLIDILALICIAGILYFRYKKR